MNNVIYITSKEDLKESIREVLKESSGETPEINLLDRLTRRQASKFLGVSYQTMHNWTKAGILKEHGTGGKKFYLRKELIEALKNNS
ncbi:MAG: helix-turn-helix domain-containing protein [Mariniphaga sp.]|nr:helix-turn-helix domain-containing protein [Mariniphaga sp.]